jgi:hypothetical protein
MFGSLSFVPLFIQGVMGASATAAGSTLTPMMLSWVLASTVGGRLLLKTGYRTLALAGMGCLTLGAFLVSQSGVDATRGQIMVYLGLMGIGMGLSVPSFLIAVQSAVPRHDLGTATSTLQFFRSIGGTLGVSVMGVFLTLRLASLLRAAGVDPSTVSLDELMGEGGASGALALTGPAHDALALAIQGIFVLALVAAALGLVATAFAPAGKIRRHAAPESAAGEEAHTPVAAASEL